MSDLKPIKVLSRILSLDLVTFHVEKIESTVLFDKSKITFEIGTNLEINVDKKLVVMNCPIQIFSSAEKNVRLGLIEVKGEFMIENFEEVNASNGIPIPVLASFNGVVISAARGMLRLLSKGTAFDEIIIPMINPMDVFKHLSPNPSPEK